MVLRDPKSILEIKKRFLKHYPSAKTELNYNNLYELVVDVILSAQCTDKRVNIITPAFFKKYPDIRSLANADLEDVKELIKSCSFFNNKAKNLIAMAKAVMEKYNGEIPADEKELIKLPGIGRKTAHVIMIEYFGKDLMAVDTHVFRVAHRLGLSDAKTPEATEKDLTEAFKTELNAIHQAMVLFGRYICKAKKPECHRCFLNDLCESEEKIASTDRA